MPFRCTLKFAFPLGHFGSNNICPPDRKPCSYFFKMSLALWRKAFFHDNPPKNGYQNLGSFAFYHSNSSLSSRGFLWSLKITFFRQKMRFNASIVFCCELALRFTHRHCQDFAYNSKSRLGVDCRPCCIKNTSMSKKFLPAAIYCSREFPTVVAHILM